MNDGVVTAVIALHYAVLLIFGVFTSAAFVGVERKKKNIIGLSIVTAVLFVVESITYLVADINIVTKLYPLITHLPLALFLIFYFRKPPLRVISGIMISYLCCQIPKWFGLLARSMGAQPISCDLIETVLLLVIGYMLIQWVCHPISEVLKIPNKSLMIFGLAPCCYYVFDYVTVVYTDFYYMLNRVALEFMPLVFGITYLVFALLYFKEYQHWQEAERMAQMLKFQSQQYTTLCNRMEETRRARHDLRQHLRLIQSYLDDGNEDALRDYIKAYGQKLPTDTGKHYCDNILADTVVRFYAEKAEELGIRFETALYLPAALTVSEPDLCVLIGNLLENALKSCEQHKGEDSFIRVGGQLAGSDTLVLTVDNGPADKPRMFRGQLLSTKHAGWGVGTSSVQNIALRYNGEANFKWQDSAFYASVVLTLPAADK